MASRTLSKSSVDSATNSRIGTVNWAQKYGKVAQTTERTNVDDQFIVKRSVLTVDDHIVQADGAKVIDHLWEQLLGDQYSSGQLIVRYTVDDTSRRFHLECFCREKSRMKVTLENLDV